ncbi:MAG: hypothetical protein GXO75_00895 [Calditrichaeota bacterium]|nr:hypothetical protein [Calditrichota bacterium]
MIRNKKYPILFLSLISLSVLFFLLKIVVSESNQEVGIVTFVQGSAKKQKHTEKLWKSVAKNSQVTGGERVRTLTRSRAELDLAHIDKIRMAPKTTIDILKLYEETKENIREANIVLQKGDLWANIAKKGKNMRLSIGTPIAAAAITGTTLRMNVQDDSTSELKVYHGQVILTNAPQSSTVIPKSIEPHEISGPHEIAGPHEVSLQEWALIVKSMQKVKVNKKGQVVYSGDFASTDSDEQSEWVRWNKERDRMSGK